MKKIFSIIAIAMFLFNVACKKDKNDSHSKSDIITSGKWKITGVRVEPGFDYDFDGDIDTEIFPLYDECDKDDYFEFKQDGTMDVNAGPLKCDASDPQVYTVDWELRNNETTIYIDGEEGKIDELSNSKLVITYQVYGEKTVVTLSKF